MDCIVSPLKNSHPQQVHMHSKGRVWLGMHLHTCILTSVHIYTSVQSQFHPQGFSLWGSQLCAGKDFKQAKIKLLRLPLKSSSLSGKSGDCFSVLARSSLCVWNELISSF